MLEYESAQSRQPCGSDTSLDDDLEMQIESTIDATKQRPFARTAPDRVGRAFWASNENSADRRGST